MLITEEYKRLNQDLHNRAVFGQRGARHADTVREMLTKYGTGSVLDYGCGRGDLAKSLSGVKVVCYDPGVARFSRAPEPCDIVVCTDVLEHIEPDCLDAVLQHLSDLTIKAAHIVIATKLDGRKKLADGRDPHLIVKPPEWWQAKLSEYMPAVMTGSTHRDCTFRVEK